VSTPSGHPLFAESGDGFTAAREAASPWGPDSLHGGAPVALMVGAIERSVDPPLRVTRVTADLVRPVPMAPLRVVTETLRPGRRVSLMAADLYAGDQLCVRLRALLLRAADVPLPVDVVRPDLSLPAALPEASQPADLDWPFVAFHTIGCEVRFARGQWMESGPAFAWIRLRHHVTADRAPSPLQRAVAAADFSNGLSAVLPLGRWLFVNPDLTVHVQRQPEGEWIGVDAVTRLGDRGTGVAHSTLYDERGYVGSAVQSLLVEPLAEPIR